MKQEIEIGAAYIRVSTHGRQEELSPDAQKRLIQEYAKTHNIHVPEEYIFIDSGISGKKANKRPEFQKMIALAKSKNKPFKVILLWKFSRFARNQEESIVYKSMLRKDGVEVISISEPLVEGPFGSLIERIIEWMDEYYSIRLSGDVTRGMMEKALRGGYQARPPLGYRIERHGEPPVIVPEEADIIRLIFHKYVNEQKPIFKIVKELNLLGLKTSHGKPFEKRSVEYILQNPTYVGKIRWNRTENETNRIKDKQEWIITDGQHEPILSDEIFNAAQARYNAEFRPKGNRPAIYKHWLSGLLKCSSCGRTLSCNHRYDRRYDTHYNNFQCYGYLKGKCLHSHSTSDRKIIPQILFTIRQDIAENSSIFRHVEIKKENSNEKELLYAQLRKLDEKEQRIKAAYRNGIDTLEEYSENKKILSAERDELKSQLEAQMEVESPEEIQTKMLERVNHVLEILSSDEYSFEKKGEAIRSIISKIIYNKEKNSIKIYYYYG